MVYLLGFSEASKQGILPAWYETNVLWGEYLFPYSSIMHQTCSWHFFLTSPPFLPWCSSPLFSTWTFSQLDNRQKSSYRNAVTSWSNLMAPGSSHEMPEYHNTSELSENLQPWNSLNDVKENTAITTAHKTFFRIIISGNHHFNPNAEKVPLCNPIYTNIYTLLYMFNPICILSRLFYSLHSFLS